MPHMANRLDVFDGRRPTGRGMLRFAGAVLVSLALWALALWGLWLIVERFAPL